jgi:hypothetical protein
VLEKGYNGFGISYEQIMTIKGANGKTANVCTGWIKRSGENSLLLTSAYVTKKKVIHRMIEKYTKVKLKDGREGVVVDYLGPDYIVDIGTSPENWDTILAKPYEIAVEK